MVTALMIAIILPVLFLDGTKALFTCKTTNPCLPVTLNVPNGQFSSPNYPNNYSVDATCVFQINVPVGHIIKVTFSDFILEPSDQTDCAGDAEGARLKFTNVGSDDLRALPFKLCGQSIPDPVYSNTNSMQITLCTGINGRKGFNASYVAIPEQELCPTLANLNDSAGEISSIYYPRKYPASETCTWQINADKGKHIQLVTSAINLPLCRNCNCDSLEVRHGVEVDGKTGKICGDTASKTFYSTFESLWVRFISDSDQAFVHNGFMATYKEINYMPPVCPSDPIPLSGNGTIRSPNFPMDEYPTTTDCSWLITVPEGKRVKLDFHTFAFDTGCNCPTQDCGSVTLYDGNSDTSPLLGKFCGTTKPPSVVSGGQHMLVVFRSNFKRERGFNATYMETLSSSTTTSTSALSSSSVAVTMTPEQTTRQTTTSLSSSSVAVTMTPEQTTRQTTTSSGCQISISLLASLVTMLAAFHWP